MVLVYVRGREESCGSSSSSSSIPNPTSEIAAAWTINVDEVSAMFTSHERIMKEIIKSDISQRVAEAQAGVDNDIERAMSDASRHLESTEILSSKMYGSEHIASPVIKRN